MKLGVLGLGVSGRSVAFEGRRKGWSVTLFDEKHLDTEERIRDCEQLQAQGVEVVTGWHARLSGGAFDWVVVSPGFPRTHVALRDAKEIGAEVLSEVEFGYRIAHAPTLAITGTNGKSTTTVMAYLMARAVNPGTELCGNISGSGYPEVAFCKAAGRAPESGLLVAEISSYQLEWVSTFRPRVACITNITPDHFDRHPTFEDYEATKLRLFAQMGEGDSVVLRESQLGTAIASAIPNECARIVVDDNEVFVLGDQALNAAEFGIHGSHNVINAKVAFAMVRAALPDAREADLIQGLRDFRALHHRNELLGQFFGKNIINSSMTTNPAALLATVKGFKEKLHVLVGGNTKGVDYSDLLSQLKASPHEFYVFGSKKPGSLREIWSGQFAEFESMEEAFEAAMENAKDGESVILAPGCASVPPHANFRERGDYFKAHVARFIESRKNEGSGKKH